jgi:formate dehydrogenase subunit gamma
MTHSRTKGTQGGESAPGDGAAELDRAGEETIRSIIARHRARRGPLIEILHEVQRALGYVPSGAVSLIAHELNLSRADVHGVLTFYHYFRSSSPGRRFVRVCRAESCQAMGARELEAHARRTLGIGFGETTADGAVTLEPVYCLGLCAMSPAVMVDDEVHGRVSPAKLDDLLSAKHEDTSS